MYITSKFDSGNIEVVSIENANDIQLKIKNDNNSEFLQWFHFKLTGNTNTKYTLKIINAHKAAYLEGWPNYQAVASYDRQTWFRVDTSYENGILMINHTLEFDNIYFAYFAPYSYERHQDLLQWAQIQQNCKLSVLGNTIDNRDISLLTVGEESESKKKCWIIARQHPGETMAEWFMEGLIERLLNTEDAVVNKLLQKVVFYLVPNMNPDGSYRGHLRTNACGANLNREWKDASQDKSPEVYYVQKAMHNTGVDFFLDAHGDEALPYNFVAGCEGNPSYNNHLKTLEDSFKEIFLQVSPEFQVEKGYPMDAPGTGNLAMATNYVGETFNCLAYTLEMPFKDNANIPDEQFGWSPYRAGKLGEDIITVLAKLIDQL